MDHGILQFLKNKMVLFGFLFNDQAIIYHQQSPLCTWQCHCRRSQSSPTHQTPAMCSGHWHFDPVYASQHLLGWSTPSLSCCVLHEAWRKAGEMPPCSTCWYLKEKKKNFQYTVCPTYQTSQILAFYLLHMFYYKLEVAGIHQCWRYGHPAVLQLHCSLHWLKSCCLKLEVLHETCSHKSSTVYIFSTLLL